jgi:hypothetical protein
MKTLTLGVPSIAADLRLKPQARKILAHLYAGKPITPLKAQTVYGVYRLAASVRELRQAGYVIFTDRCVDEGGHKYARYTMPKRTRKAA